MKLKGFLNSQITYQNNMFIKLYRITSDIFLIPILFFFSIRLIFGKEKISSVLEKFALTLKPRPSGNLIWINGVSIGEAKTAVTVADVIKKSKPQSTILISTSTITSYNLISKMNKNFIIVYAPLDINFIVKRFLKHWKPKSTIFIESEIWPNIFYNLKKQSVELRIFNARMSNRSFLNWKKFYFISKDIFKFIDECFVQDQESMGRFKKLGVKKIKKISNLKFLSEPLKVDKNNYKSLKKQLKKMEIITLFSSHNREEKLLLKCHKILSKKNKNIFFVIIPRHINRVNKIIQEFREEKVLYKLRTSKNLKITNEKFLIVNTFGELGLFFKLSSIALIGGSFYNYGGHNPIETKGFECSLVFGSYMQNFDDIKDIILRNKAGFQVNDLTQLEKTISKLIENKKLSSQTHKNFKNLCSRKSKETKIMLRKLLK